MKKYGRIPLPKLAGHLNRRYFAQGVILLCTCLGFVWLTSKSHVNCSLTSGSQASARQLRTQLANMKGPEEAGAQPKLVPWDGKSPLYMGSMLEKGEFCGMWNYFSRVGGIPRFKICLRPYHDIVSDSIRESGRWSSCDSHARTFKRAVRRGIEKHDPQNETLDVFLEAGANIGACTLTLLAAGAKVVAFEPSPSNLFYLTSSILANRERFPNWTDRLKLYPVALGESNADSRIYESRGNAGNSAVSKPIGEDGNEISDMSRAAHRGIAGPVRNVFDIYVRKLDDILQEDMHRMRIRLMKMDVQGFETFILRGATQLFKSRAVEAVHYELASRFLRAQGSSVLELHELLIASGFKVERCDKVHVLNHASGEVQGSDLRALPENVHTDCEASLRE